VVRRRVAYLTALLVAVGSAVVACGSGDNPANDFCTSYGDAMHAVVAAAHASDPAAFSATFKSTKDALAAIRAKAPDDKLRAAFDRSMFSLSVFSNDADLADFMSRSNFAEDATVVACGEYGVEMHV
jgi:hypothetical protein